MRRPGFAELETKWQWVAASKPLPVTVVQGMRFAPYRRSLSVDATDAKGTTKRVRIAIPAQQSSTITVPVTLALAPGAVVFDVDVSMGGTILAR